VRDLAGCFDEMANTISKLAIGACTIALVFGCISHRAAHAESLAHDPDAALDRESGVRNTRGRMDKLDVDVVDILPSPGTHPSMLGLGLGYRILPELTTGLYFDAALIGATQPDTDPCHASGDCFRRHVRFGTFVQMHLMPNSAIDPWFSIGAGGTTYEKLGLDASATAGLDFRFADILALGPMFTRTQTLSGPAPSWNALGVHVLLTF
jgi:hypothetical protein